ncbi:MAG TPA: hypothetical protein V6C81_14280 [Planktothrix sp.]|jgi:hypothetical protein
MNHPAQCIAISDMWKSRPWPIWLILFTRIVAFPFEIAAVLHIYGGLPVNQLLSKYLDEVSFLSNNLVVIGSVLDLVSVVQLVRLRTSAPLLWTVTVIYAIAVQVQEGCESGYWVYIWTHGNLLSGMFDAFYVAIPDVLVTCYAWFLYANGTLRQKPS